MLRVSRYKIRAYFWWWNVISSVLIATISSNWLFYTVILLVMMKSCQHCSDGSRVRSAVKWIFVRCVVAANVQWLQYSDQDQWWPQAAPLLHCSHADGWVTGAASLPPPLTAQRWQRSTTGRQPAPVCSSSRYKYISQVNVWPPLTQLLRFIKMILICDFSESFQMQQHDTDRYQTFIFISHSGKSWFFWCWKCFIFNILRNHE